MAGFIELRWMAVPFLACLVLSINHVYLGIHVISRKVIFVDLALAQIAALGATYAVSLGYDPNTDVLAIALFSLAFTFAGAGAFAIARMRKERVPQEAFIGIIYAVTSAAAILLLSKSATGGEELKHMLVGDVLLVSLSDVGNMTVLYAAIGVFHIIFRRQFLRISLDPEGAEASGMNIRLWDILFYMSFGVVIVKSVVIVGVLLVFSYLVVPAVIAQMFSDTVLGRLWFGWLIAVLASVLGIVWSFYADYPTGPAVVVMLGLLLVIASAVYYVGRAPVKLKAAANVAALTAAVAVFFFALSYFKKTDVAVAKHQGAPIDLLLQELKGDEEVHQLDAMAHLADMRDGRIVPALTEVLAQTQSPQVVEAAVEALKKQRDARAIAALRRAADGQHDDFLKLTIAKAELELGDRQGIAVLIEILGRGEAALARQQANEALEEQSGQRFGYRAERTAAENRAALQKIDEWWKREKGKVQADEKITER
jgi:zinc/manganese transport system permease protein